MGFYVHQFLVHHLFPGYENLFIIDRLGFGSTNFVIFLLLHVLGLMNLYLLDQHERFKKMLS